MSVDWLCSYGGEQQQVQTAARIRRESTVDPNSLSSKSEKALSLPNEEMFSCTKFHKAKNFPVAVRRFGDELIFQMSTLKPKGMSIMTFFILLLLLFSFSSVWLFLISASDWENLNTQQCVGLPCQQTKLSSHVNPTIMANRDVWAVRNPFLASPVAHEGTKALWSGSHLQNLQLTRQQLKRSLPNNCYLCYWQPQGMKTLYRFHHSAQIALTHLLICMIFYCLCDGVTQHYCLN